jgi:hypothetical protein
MPTRANKKDRAINKGLANDKIGALSVTTANAVASVGVPTKVEFDAVVALANELKTDLNALITALKS